MNVQFTKSGCKLKNVLACRWYTPDPEQSRTRHQLPLLLKWVPETPAYRSRNQNTAGLFQFAQQLFTFQLLTTCFDLSSPSSIVVPTEKIWYNCIKLSYGTMGCQPSNLFIGL